MMTHLKFSPRSGALAVLAAATLAFSVPDFAHSQSTPPAGTEINAETTVVATVGEREIFLADLIRMQQTLPAQYRQIPFEQLYKPLLERAISSAVIGKAARESEIAKRPDVMRRAEAAADDVYSEVYLSETISADITDEAMAKRYEAFAAELGTKEEARARHILLEKEADALDVIEALKNGADFAEVAKERSTGPSSVEGGDLGWFEAQQMVPEFSAAAFALEPGKFTEQPVKTQFGWHVILLEDTRSIGAPAFEQVKDQLAAELSRELITAKIKELTSASKVQRFDLEGNPIEAPKAVQQ